MRELGDVVFGFREEIYFRPRVELRPRMANLSAASCRLQEKFQHGPRAERLNAAMLTAVGRVRPQAVIVFRGEQILPRTIRAIRETRALVAAYRNDDPSSLSRPAYVWRHFVASVPCFGHVFAYRQENCSDLADAGARQVSPLRSFYLREEHPPIPGRAKDLDVSFVGHWEDDRRTEHVEAILGVPSIRFGLWGGNWHTSPLAEVLRERFGPLNVLEPPEYNRTTNRSKVCVGFLSAINNDTYTRRCFEIPAAGGFMLAPYTEDLAALFRESQEAEYFRSSGEMLDKIRFYLDHDVVRERIAWAGCQRLLRDGHEALDRARQMREEILRLL